MRANWKGVLRLGELSCPVALYTAASTSGRIAFHRINPATGHRLHRSFVDAETGETVPAEDQLRGHEAEDGALVILDPEDIAAAVPVSDKVLEVEAILPCAEVDDTYFDKPYYLAPPDRHGAEAYALIAQGLRAAEATALARTVLFRRMRSVLIRADGAGLIATTLNFDYEVRSAEAAFRDLPNPEFPAEMLDLARHIISTKAGHFDPEAFDDRYEEALAQLIRARIEGRDLPARPKAPRQTGGNLLQALKESAGLGKAAARKPRRAKAG